jgi:penicillin-binding protein 2
VPNLFTLKDHFKESQLYLNRTVAAMIIILIAFLGLISRLAFLQIYQYDLYKTLSLNNQIRIVPIVPNRGLIYDRNGVLLAENIPAFSLTIMPEHIDNINETLDAIDKIIPLSEGERQSFMKQLKYKRNNEGIPLRLKLTEEEVAKFSLEKHHFSGVDIVARLIRWYPLGEAFAHALGYIGPISERDLEHINAAQYRGMYHIGKTGLEKFYENELHGQSGYQHVETDARGRRIRVLNRIPPQPGLNIHLALDSELQKAAFEALGENKGSVIVIDPRNGEVLTLVSKPSFDPNLFAQGIDTTRYKALQTAPDRPLFNRAIQGQYPPGSTIKPLVAIQGLELGIITPSFGLFDPGWYQLHAGGRLFRDWIFHSKRHGHGWVDLEKAIAQSCDTYFFSLAHKLGIRHLNDIYVRFGLGTPTRVDLVGEASGIVPSAELKRKTRKEDWYPGDTLNVGIGQGMMLATPLQMAQVAATLANRGTGFVPRLVHAVSEGQGTESQLEPKKGVTVTINHAQHWNTVIQAMQKVVHAPGGTAYRTSHGITYQVAGKTGTAQVFNLKQNEKYEASRVKAHLRDHSWFIGFAPVDNPELAIAILVENKQNKTGADIARVVLDHYFKVTKGSSTQMESKVQPMSISSEVVPPLSPNITHSEE